MLFRSQSDRRSNQLSIRRIRDHLFGQSLGSVCHARRVIISLWGSAFVVLGGLAGLVETRADGLDLGRDHLLVRIRVQRVNSGRKPARLAQAGANRVAERPLKPFRCFNQLR